MKTEPQDDDLSKGEAGVAASRESDIRMAESNEMIQKATEEPGPEGDQPIEEEPLAESIQQERVADSPSPHSLSLPVDSIEASRPRQNSIVSFNDECTFYEIDAEKGERDKQHIKKKPSPLKSVRYYVMILALISPFVVTYSKTIINFAITDMIHPDMRKPETTNNSLTTDDFYPFEVDNSCPVDEEIRARLVSELSQDKKRAETPGEKFQWDAFKQGMLKSAYAIGHAPLQIPGGRVSEIYGAHLVMSISSILIAICCILAPYLAAIDFYLLFADLVVLGALGSFMTPALITLISNWLTTGEKYIMMSFYLIASRLGSALSSFLCGLLIQAQLSWRYVFFTAGWTAGAFSALFFIFARGKPSDHFLISQLELDYLASKNVLVRDSLTKKKRAQNESRAQKYELKETKFQPKKAHVRNKKGAPWLAIFTNIPVWAFIITKFCVKLAGDTVQNELPVYLKRVMHLSAKENGSINSLNYVFFCIGCFLVGALAKVTMKRRPFGLSKTTIRKCFQCTASFGVSIILVGVAFSMCDSLSTQVLLYSMFVVTTFGTGGEAQIPLDIAGKYSGTIHAIGSSLAISSVIEPMTVGYYLKGREPDRDSWKVIWMAAGAISLTGGLIFFFFGDATTQKFGLIENDEEKNGSTGKTQENPVANGMKSIINEEKQDHNQGDKKSDEGGQPFKESRQI